MKKKITALILCFSLVAAAIVGGSLAYFTDKDQAENVFTVGNVKVRLNEEQRDGKGSLEKFEDGKTLTPVFGEVPGDKDGFGLSQTESYVDKIITVTNEGANSEYVRVFVAVPKALEKVDDNPDYVALRCVNGSDYSPDGNYSGAPNPDWSNWSDPPEDVEAVIDGTDYIIHIYTYNKALVSGETTGSACVAGFYLDGRVDSDKEIDGGYVYVLPDGTPKHIDYDFTNGVKVPVFVQAIQAEGFPSAAEAFAASGLSKNPWE